MTQPVPNKMDCTMYNIFSQRQTLQLVVTYSSRGVYTHEKTIIIRLWQPTKKKKHITRRIILDDVSRTTISADGQSGCCSWRFTLNLHLCLDGCWFRHSSIINNTCFEWRIKWLREWSTKFETRCNNTWICWSRWVISTGERSRPGPITAWGGSGRWTTRLMTNWFQLFFQWRNK